MLTRLGYCHRRWQGAGVSGMVLMRDRRSRRCTGLDRQLHVHQRAVLLGAVDVGVLVREEWASNSLGLRW